MKDLLFSLECHLAGSFTYNVIPSLYSHYINEWGCRYTCAVYCIILIARCQNKWWFAHLSFLVMGLCLYCIQCLCLTDMVHSRPTIEMMELLEQSVKVYTTEFTRYLEFMGYSIAYYFGMHMMSSEIYSSIIALMSVDNMRLICLFCRIGLVNFLGLPWSFSSGGGLHFISQ